MFENKYDRIIYFDTETTGLNANCNRITELAYAVVTKNNTIKWYNDFIKIDDTQQYNAKAEEITGITRAYLNSVGKEAKDVITKFHNILFESPNTLLCAYNAAFDISFITNEFARIDLKYKQPIDFLDPCTVYHDITSGPHKLMNAIQFFNIKNVQNSHNALDDVKALMAVTESIQKKYQNLEKYINLMGYYGTFDQIKCPWVTYVPFTIKSTVPLYEAYKYYTSSKNEKRPNNEITDNRPGCNYKSA